MRTERKLVRGKLLKIYDTDSTTTFFFLRRNRILTMWLPSALLTVTLTLLTFAHAERDRPTLKDDERFRTGPFRVSLRELQLENLRERQLAMKSINYINLLNMNRISPTNMYRTCVSKVSLSRNCSLNVSAVLTLMCSDEQEASCGINSIKYGKHARPSKLSCRDRISEHCLRKSQVTFFSSLAICIISICMLCILFYCIYLGLVTKSCVQQHVRRCLPSCLLILLKCETESCESETEPVCTSQNIIVPTAEYSPQACSQLQVEVIPSGLTLSRSRYAKFHQYGYDNCVLRVTISRNRNVARRARAPSRIPAKKLSRVLNKSRKIRRVFRHYIKKNIPKSSHIHRLLYAFTHERKRILKDWPSYLSIKVIGRPQSRKKQNVYTVTNKVCAQGKSSTKRRCVLTKDIKSKCNCKPTLQLCCTGTYKGLNHRKHCCESKLSTDIETNPGPVFVNPAKTIHAPYSQGNVNVFGLNAGKQCVAMSLCCLIYKHSNGPITERQHIIEIMNIGNELYSALSRLTGQTYLLLSELPNMVTIHYTNYQLEFSESYSGNLHEETVRCNQDIPYVMPLDCAFQHLQYEYNAFLLTISCITVAVYCTPNGTLKVFDSHARDSFGLPNPHGTCVLLDVDNISNLLGYFRTLYKQNTLFELKGVKILLKPTVGTCQMHSPQLSGENVAEHSFPKQCSVCFYAICFSTISACNYWNNETLAAIAEHANNVTYESLPEHVNIFGGEVTNIFSIKYQGKLIADSVPSKQALKELILKKMAENTGFVLWSTNVFLACIFQRQKTCLKYFVLRCNEKLMIDFFEKFSGVELVVNKICDLCKPEMEYHIHFLSSSCEITKTKRAEILRKHKTFEYISRQKRKQSDNEKKCYINLEPAKKKEKLEKRTVQYKSMDNIEKQHMLDKKVAKYKTMHPKQTNILNNLDRCILKFKSKITEGPYYICTTCNRLLYRKTVRILDKSKYSTVNCPSKTLFTGKMSFDGKKYICQTCHLKISKGKIPCQAICNNMYVDEVPVELSSLEKLEQILIAQRIVFEKIIIMPKGQQRKVKGAICNVPVECDETCKILPRPPERSGIIMLKLKRKLQFRGHVYFQAVRLEFLINALHWLKLNNLLYHDITINTQPLTENFTTLGIENTTSQNVADDNQKSVGKNLNDDKDDDEEIREDPLNEYRQAANETCLQAVLPDYPVTSDSSEKSSLGNEVYNIAPGENKHPVSIMRDTKCEELAFPVLFPKGRFGYTYNRDITLTPVKYFNARLLHYSGRFAMNPEYLFFAQFVMEQKKVSDSINIALKKVNGQAITASQVKSDVNQLKGMICQDQAYLFLRQIPGTPPYWQKFMYEVVAMVKQLGIPTWFMTLSCADLRWPELFQIIARTQGQNMSVEEVEALSYTERCSMLNLNPVIVAKHFQHRVETFFTEVLLSQVNPIGKIIYYALRIEFQMRGSPHLHALIWTSDCPKLDADNKDGYINFIDDHVQAHLPDESTEPELHQLVKLYQKHSHSKTCRKYKNTSCRFNFGQFFTNRTIIAEPLSSDLDEGIKAQIFERRIQILTKVKQKIDEVLNPSNSDYDKTLTEQDILASLDITEDQYYWALSISPDSDFDLHLKRPVDSCFINNYFVAGIKGFAANVDLQPVFNHYKCITYVCSYFTKDETECSQAIVNAAKEAKAENMSIRDGLKNIGAAFLSTREVSSQECVYRSMPELWLRKIFPRTVFVSTDFPEKRVRVAKTQEELNELDDDSTDIYKSNIIERYSIRPTNIPAVNNLCLAKFAAYYYKDYKINCDDVNDSQPEVLTDELIESQATGSNITEDLPKKIKLLTANEYMKCRKVKAVVRCHRPNKHKQPEAFFHHLLMLYYPWRDESSLMAEDQTYTTRYSQPEVKAIVEQNRAIFEPDADAIDEAFESVRSNTGNIHSFDVLNDQENADIHGEMQDDFPNESFNEQQPSHLGSESNNATPGAISSYNQPTAISDDKLRENIRSLNTEQRHAYDTFLTWCRSKMKNLNSLKPVEVEPIYLFITGGGGAGKSHLIKTIYHTAVKTFRHPPINPELPTVLLMAPTGVAAINIDGTTINTALAIPKETGDNLPAMSDQKKTQLRLTLLDLKLIIIDEISMVGNTTLLHVHQRLKEIFGTPSSLLFAGMSIIVVGDLCQLPPIRKRFIFDQYKNDLLNLMHPWKVFKMIELTQIMRQRDDQAFIQLLNRVRTATQSEDDINVIQSRCITPDDPNYPSDALHIWAENKPVDDHNKVKLEELPGSLHNLRAKDQYPANVSKQDIDRVLARGRSETGGLDYEIHIKEGARVMLTTNICIADRLINGQMGTVVRVQTNQADNPTVLYIKFDDPNAGKELITKGSNFARENHVVPIEPVLAKIKIRPGKASSPEIQRVQFPVTLAWACTVHKVQGLTLDKVVLSTELNKQRSFNYGQIYVALSRATSLNGLFILGKVESKHIKTNPKVLSEYERLQACNIVANQNDLYSNCNVFTLTLLNVRSLRKHSIDVKHDSRLFKSNVLAFTETQLLPHESDHDIISNLKPFMLHRQDHISDRYSSMAVCSKNTTVITNIQFFPQINAVKFELTTGTTQPPQPARTLLLLYRKQSTHIQQYLSYLRNILDSHMIHLVFGDFNINYFDDSQVKTLRLLMDSLAYEQIVKSPTFVSSGSLLDHVYAKLGTLDVLQIDVINLYFSDHDAVTITFK